MCEQINEYLPKRFTYSKLGIKQESQLLRYYKTASLITLNDEIGTEYSKIFPQWNNIVMSMVCKYTMK